MINTEKRKRVMQRSIRLGHCICNHRLPYPCDVFKEKNICSCAGERPEAPTGPVQLTKPVEKAGCASKIDQAFLKQVLKDLPAVDDPRVLVGVPAEDEAGVAIIGGHSINDSEIKAGFAVTSTIETDKIVTNAAARPGDVLILTKPLGTGIVAFVSQIGRANADSVEAAATSMTALNKKASQLMVKFGAHACTDVTGFSLMDHLSEMALSSGVDVEIIWDDIPLFPGVLEYAAAGILPGAIERNKESCGDRIVTDDALSQEMVDMCYDAQTSGGLLIAIAESDAEVFLKALHKNGISTAAIVGRVSAKVSGLVHIKTSGKRKIPSPGLAGTPAMPVDEGRIRSNKQTDSEEVACCADAATSSASPADGSDIAQIKAKFNDFLGVASSPHGLDAYTKQAMAIVLSVATRCEPCLKMHLKNAKEKGFTQDEIDEAAWMGISFAGSLAMVFYEQQKNS